MHLEHFEISSAWHLQYSFATEHMQSTENSEYSILGTQDSCNNPSNDPPKKDVTVCQGFLVLNELSSYLNGEEEKSDQNSERNKA